MPVFNLYSRRKQQAEKTQPDVYQYDFIPEKVRNQIVHIWEDAFGSYEDFNSRPWKSIRDAIYREHGIPLSRSAVLPGAQCIAYLNSDRSIEEILDILDLSFWYIHHIVSSEPVHRWLEYGVLRQAKGAIDELNTRLLQGGVGYQFESGQIVRIDSNLIHSEVVRPALCLLSDSRFAGAQDEFLTAHKHYVLGEYKDAITDANNAFESTLKTVCDIKGWRYDKGAQASHLLNSVRNNGLFPNYMSNSFDQLAATLKSGLPVVRNNEGSHGQGSEPRATPGHVAAYALHLAAAKIVFLVESLKESGGA